MKNIMKNWDKYISDKGKLQWGLSIRKPNSNHDSILLMVNVGSGSTWHKAKATVDNINHTRVIGDNTDYKIENMKIKSIFH